MISNLKESNIKWLKEIPINWEVYPLGMYLKERNEKVSDLDYEPLSVTKNGIVPQLDNAAKSDAHDDRKKVLKKDFVINSRSDRKQSCGISELDGSVSLINIVLKINKYNPEYIKYLLNNSMFAEEFYSNGHGIVADLWTTRYKDMSRIYLPFPPLKEQTKIANYLDKKIKLIDELIDRYNKNIQLLKEYKRSKIKEIFDNWLENSKYTKEKLGRLSSLVTKQTGFDYSSTIKPSLLDNPNENTIPYLQTRNFKDNYFNFKTEFNVPINIAEKFPKILLDKKCMLFSIVGASIGNVAVYPGNVKAFLGGAICKVDLLNEELYEYIKDYMISEYGQLQINDKINASAQPTITVQNVRDFVIPIPDKSIRNKIVNIINKENKKIDILLEGRSKIVEKLEEYKKSLIYEVVTGKKEIK